MSWAGVLQAIIIACLILAALLWWAWPRHLNGKPFSIEETQELLEKLPKASPGERGRKIVLGFLLFIAMLAVSLTKKDRTRDEDDDF